MKIIYNNEEIEFTDNEIPGEVEFDYKEFNKNELNNMINDTELVEPGSDI